jgi:hypothetical protein
MGAHAPRADAGTDRARTKTRSAGLAGASGAYSLFTCLGVRRYRRALAFGVHDATCPGQTSRGWSMATGRTGAPALEFGDAAESGADALAAVRKQMGAERSNTIGAESNVCVVPTDGSIPPIIKRRKCAKVSRSARVFYSEGVFEPPGLWKSGGYFVFWVWGVTPERFWFFEVPGRFLGINASGFGYARRMRTSNNASRQLCSERSQYLAFLIHLFGKRRWAAPRETLRKSCKALAPPKRKFFQVPFKNFQNIYNNKTQKFPSVILFKPTKIRLERGRAQNQARWGSSRPFGAYQARGGGISGVPWKIMEHVAERQGTRRRRQGVSPFAGPPSPLSAQPRNGLPWRLLTEVSRHFHECFVIIWQARRSTKRRNKAPVPRGTRRQRQRYLLAFSAIAGCEARGATFVLFLRVLRFFREHRLLASTTCLGSSRLRAGGCNAAIFGHNSTLM